MRITIQTPSEEIDATIDVSRMINLGSATRDAGAAVAHQEEVAKEGVRIAFDIPAPRLYPIGTWTLTTADVIGVQGARTSGEVEIVLVQDDELLIGVGSDHTDRDLETISIPWSKQACPNVIAPVLWRWKDLADHWDDLVLECDVDGEPYQRVGVDVFLHPHEILRIVHERAQLPDRGLIVYCGTFASINESLEFGSEWSYRLIDPILGRSLSHRYRVEPLFDDVREDFRVPLHW